MTQAALKSESRDFRLRLRLLVTIESINISGDYFIENLSSGGLFIETRFPLEEGEKCEISFSLPHNRQSYTIPSEVIWKRDTDHNGLMPGMGIRFVGVSEKEESEIFSALNQYKELLNDQ